MPSNRGKDKEDVHIYKNISRVQLFVIPQTIQNTGMGSLSLLQGIFPTQGSNLGLLHCRQVLYQLSYQGSPNEILTPALNKKERKNAICSYMHGTRDYHVMTNLDSILKSRDITLPTKVRLVKAMVFPVVMYGCESWTVKRLRAEELMLLNCGVGEDS